MAIEAGRVGVRADQVDPYGRIKGGGGGTDPAVTKLQTQVGTYSFRTNPEDGSAQYRKSDEDEWKNFSSGGGASPVLLWENENVSAGINVNTLIPLDLANYSHIIVVCTPEPNFTSNMSYGISILEKRIAEVGIFRQNLDGGSNNAIIFGRIATFTENGLNIESLGTYINTAYTGQVGQSATVAIPTRIYGVNLDL